MKKKLLLNRIAVIGGLLLLMMFGRATAQTKSLSTANSTKGQQTTQSLSSDNLAKPTENMHQDSPFEMMKGKVEDVSKRTADSKHFKNGDGSMTAVIGVGPIHYLKNGIYEDINTKIVAQNNSVYPFVNKTNLMESHFGTSSKDGIVSRTKEGEVKEFLNLKMYWEVAGQSIGLKESTDVPISVVDNKAYYHNLFPSISAEFILENGRRKLNYIIPDKKSIKNAPTNVEFLVFEEEIFLPNGWTHEVTEDGVYLKNVEGREMYIYENPYSFDASEEFIRDKNTLFETLLKGNTLIIKTKVKTSWLFDKRRQYPVKVDPTFTQLIGAAVERGYSQSNGTGAYTALRFGLISNLWNLGYVSYNLATWNSTWIPSDVSITVGGSSTGTINASSQEQIQRVTVNPDDYATWASYYTAQNSMANYAVFTGAGNMAGTKSLGAAAVTQLLSDINTTYKKFTVGFKAGGTWNNGSYITWTTATLNVVYTLGNVPPSCVTILSPTNGATGTAHQGTISWNASAGATGYDVYFGVSATPPLVSTNQTTTTYTLPSCLSPLTTYYWRIVPRNANGSSTGCATWSFTTDNKLHIYQNDWETANVGFFGTSGVSVDGWFTNNNTGTGGSPTSGYNNTWTVGNGIYAISSKSVGVSALNNGGLAGSYFDYYDDLGEIHRWIYRPFNMTGLRDIDVMFRWKSGGTLDKKYGSVISSINNGANWLMDTQGGLTNDGKYWNSPNTIRTQTIALPPTRNNQPNFQLGFKWDDSGDNSTGIVPSFVVDDILIKACPYEGTINSTAVSSGVYEWSPTGNTQTTLSIVGTYQCAQFQWEQSTDGGTTWVNVIGGSGATAISYTTPNNLTSDTWYRCKVYFSTGCLGVYQVESFKILFCEKTWSGSTTDWATANNWNPTGIPNANHCVKIPSITVKPTIQVGTNALAKNLTIEAGGQLNVKGDLTVTDFIENSGTAADFTIESDANLIQINSAENIGNITLKRDSKMKRLDYTYWGSPVTGQTFFNFSSNTVASRFYRYNEEFDSFHTIANLNDPMMAGEGYAIRAPNNLNATIPTTWTGIFVGKPNNGEVTFPVTKHPDSPLDPGNSSSEIISRGKNMLSNPYPSNLDLEALTDANSATATGVYYFWTNTNDFVDNTQVPGNGTYGNYGSNHYATYNSTGAVPAANTVNGQLPTRFIRPGQGFLYEAKDNGTVTFNNSMRSADPNSHFISNKNGENTPERFWLKLTTPINNSNILLIAYLPGATNLYEPRYDAKFPQKSSDRFYSVVDDKELVIQGRQYPFSTTDHVKIGMAHFVEGNYKMEIADREGIFATAQNIYLKDKQTGIITNLSQGSYSYSAEAGKNDTRFEIIYEPETVLAANQSLKAEHIVYRDRSDFVVRSKDQEIDDIEVYDAAGRLVLKAKGKRTKELRFSAEKLQQGMYILKVMTNGGVFTKKIMNY